MDEAARRQGRIANSPMNYEDFWQIQDEITAAVNSLGFSLWDLHYDRSSFAFHMELNEHLPDEALSYFCSQMPLATDYDGEGSHGSVFTLSDAFYFSYPSKMGY